MEYNKKKLEEKYYELQTLDKQIKQLQAHFQNLENQIIEFHLVKQGLNELNDTKLENELLVPISPGMFIKTALRNNTEVIVNVGANVAVKKTVNQAKDMMNLQTAEVKKVQTNILMDLQKLSERAVSLEKEINELVTELNKK